MQDLHVIQKELGSNKFSTTFRNSVFTLTTPLAKDALFNHTRGLAEIQGSIAQSLRTHSDEFNLEDRFGLHGLEEVGGVGSFKALDQKVGVQGASSAGQAKRALSPRQLKRKEENDR